MMFVGWNEGGGKKKGKKRKKERVKYGIERCVDTIIYAGSAAEIAHVVCDDVDH